MDPKAAAASNIKVFCRFRPFNKVELENKAQKIHRIASGKQLIIKDPNRSDEISFMFDSVFDCDSTQEQVYQSVGQPVLGNILDGFNGTIMAYGQTSSGKTHTMQGHDINDKEMKGLIPRIIENLFAAIQKSAENLQFKLKVSIFELYMQKIRDLLDVSKTDLKIRENKSSGPYVQHLTEAYISDKVQLYKLIHLGQKNRATCMTNMNALSSRSHMIFLLTLSQMNLETSQAKISKLFLIDLAGSEKVSKTGAEGKVLEQAKKINLSLTSLGMVIKSLSQNQAHIPYRDSKLTRIIKDSLGGNAKTTLIVACSPHEMHISQTISTLRFGQNAQKIKNKPKINRELTVPELQKIIQELEGRIEEKNQWIRVLEEYIQRELGAALPKFQRKKLGQGQKGVLDKEEVQHINEVVEELQLHEELVPKRRSAIEEEQGEHQPENQEQPQPELEIEKPISPIKDSIQIQTDPNIPQPQQPQPNLQLSYNLQHILSLQTQLSSYKQNLQSQLTKFYQLKKQYNSLNENLKELIEQNIGYQEREKQYEGRLVEQRDEVVGKFRRACALVFGEIVESVGGCVGNGKGKGGCYERVRGVIDGKGRVLCFEGQNIDFFDYWKTQKQSINKKMQQIIDKSLHLQKKLQTPKPTPTPTPSSQQSESQNRKILQMQQKLDNLYTEYQQMLILQTNWKVQCQLYERKLKMKEEKIVELRAMLQEVQEQMEMMDEENGETMSVNTKIVKPLKGGFLFR